MSVEAMRKAVADRLRESVAALAERSGDTADGRDWEWAAPAVIDAMAKASSVAWVNSPYGFALLGNEEGFKEHVAELRISEVLDTHFAKSRTSVSLSPGQFAQIGQECLVEFQAAMISAFSPWVKRDGARVLRMLSPSRAMR